PSSLTRSRNAGGNAYSRPQSSPTFMASSHVVGARRLLDAVARLVDEHLHHGAQIAGTAVDVELPIGARAFGENRSHVFDLAPAVQLVDHVVHEREEL